MRDITIYDGELDDVAVFNTLSERFFAASSASFLFALGMLVNAFMQDEISHRAWGALEIGIPTGIIFSIGFLFAGRWAVAKKTSKVDRMKSQLIGT